MSFREAMDAYDTCEALFVKARTKSGRYLSVKDIQKMLTFQQIHLCKIREYHFFCVEKYGRLQYIRSDTDIEWFLEHTGSLRDNWSQLSQSCLLDSQKIELLLMIDFGERT